MKSKFFALLACCGLLATLSAAQPNTLTPAESAAGCHLLFDGKSLDGWQAPEKPEVFTVADGQIIVKGPRSHLFYTGQLAGHDFRNFELSIDVLTKPRANSGVYFHTEFQPTGWPFKGYEVQVNNSHSDPSRSAGLWGIKANLESVAKDDEWFTMNIRVEGKRIVTLSSDFAGGTERLKLELEQVAAGAFDVIIGTQLVAKGHNFPQLTLVGVIDADVGLSSGDPRAAERTFQMLQQVTGRAGRGDRPGIGLVQTYQPDHPVIRALVSGDSERFFSEEAEQRRRAGLPPFGRLAALIVSGKDRASAETHSRALVRAAHGLAPSDRWAMTPAGQMPQDDDLVILGPAEAPIAVVRGRHRFRLLVRAPRSADMQGFLRAMIGAAPPERGGVRVDVDVDPMSFL